VIADRLGLISVPAALALASCSEPDLPAIRYHTEHLEIGTDYDEPTCAGTLAALERHAVLLEQWLDTSIDSKIEVYLFEDGDPPCVEEPVSGCFDPGTGQVITRFGSARHELAHAVSHQWGSPDHFYSEGLARAFSGERTVFRGADALPSRSLGLDVFEIPGGAAGHFVRWLYERHGPAPLATLFCKSEAGDPSDAFRETYGMTIEDAEQSYFAEGPEAYPGLSFCTHEVEVLPWQDGVFRHAVELDCDQDHTRGFRSMARTIGFEIDEPGLYAFEIEEPARARIFTCQTEIVEAGVALPASFSPIGDEPGGSLWSPPETIASGQLVDLALERGRHRMTIEVPDAGTTTIRVHLASKFSVPAREPAE
jgi:hypothetical protein